MSDHQHLSLLIEEVDISSFQIQLTNIFCDILLILGLVGNSLGLLIFSLSCRVSSTYACLATCSSITNLLCVIRFASILHSSSRHILRQLIGHTWWACKAYEISFAFRVISSWITLFWMFERLLCVSKRLRKVFHRWNSFQVKLITPMIIMVMILVCVIGPSVYMFESNIMLSNDTMNSTMNTMICRVNRNASMRWQRYFGEFHFGINHFTIRCLFSELIPTGAIILFNIYILHHLQTRRRFRDTSDGQRSKIQSETISWMNAVLILHSFLFLVSLIAHIIGHFMSADAHDVWWVLLAVLINCSLNFYIYCLSGEAFRKQICRFGQRCQAQLLYKLHARSRRRQRCCYPLQNTHLIYEMRTFRIAR